MFQHAPVSLTIQVENNSHRAQALGDPQMEPEQESFSLRIVHVDAESCFGKAALKEVLRRSNSSKINVVRVGYKSI